MADVASRIGKYMSTRFPRALDLLDPWVNLESIRDMDQTLASLDHTYRTNMEITSTLTSEILAANRAYNVTLALDFMQQQTLLVWKVLITSGADSMFNDLVASHFLLSPEIVATVHVGAANCTGFLCQGHAFKVRVREIVSEAETSTLRSGREKPRKVKREMKCEKRKAIQIETTVRTMTG